MRSMIRPLSLAGLAAVGLLVAASCTPRAQATTEPFAAERFAELQAEGALVLVDVAAPWCGTCVIQGDILASYQTEKPDAPLLILRVDYDTQKDVHAALRAPAREHSDPVPGRAGALSQCRRDRPRDDRGRPRPGRRFPVTLEVASVPLAAAAGALGVLSPACGRWCRW